MSSESYLEGVESAKIVLKETKELKNKIGDIRDVLQKMIIAKKEGSHNQLNSSFSERNTITQYLKMKTMRQKHRLIQCSIEEERSKIRFEKEKIEKTSVYLQGLEYLQSTIQNSIHKCQSINMDSLPKVNNHEIQSQLKRKPLQDFEGSDFVELRTELETELQKRIKKNEERINISSQLVSQQQKYDSVINQYGQQLPPILLNLAENLKGLNSVFAPITNTPLPLNVIQHNLASQLPPPLYNVYSKLSLLFETTPSLSSSVEILQQSTNQSNNKRQNEIHHLELCVTIKEYVPSIINNLDSFLSTYKLTAQKSTLASAYPIKFFIRYIENLNTLIVQLDSKHLKGKEIFSGLFQNDFGSPLILYTNDEYDKNLNQQYEFYNWLQVLGGINNKGDNTQKIDAELIIRKINERFISKRFVKNIIDALVSNTFTIHPLLKSQKEIVAESELSKYKFEQKQKLSNSNDLANSTFYKHLKPVWLKKKQDSQYDLIEEEVNSKKLVQQISSQIIQQQNPQNPSISFAQSYLIPQNDVLKMISLDNESNETEIHLFNIQKGDQLNAQVVIIMPLSTLVQQPCIKILSASIKLNQPIKTPLTQLFNKDIIIQNADFKENKGGDNQQQLNTHNLSSLIINQIENEMKQIEEFMPEDNSKNSNNNGVGKNVTYSLIYQLNRLITLLEICINHYQKYGNMGSKCFAATPYDMLDI